MRPQRTTSKIVFRNVLFGTASAILTRLASIVFIIILTRLLLPGDFGIYALTLTIAAFAFESFDLGINSALSRFLPPSLARARAREVAGYFQYFLRIKILVSIVLGTAITLLAEPISLLIFSKPELIEPLRLGGLFIFAMSLFGFFQAIFYAVQRVRDVFVGNSIYEFSRLLMVPLLVILGYSIVGAIAGLIISVGLALAAFLVMAYRHCDYLFSRPPKRIKLKTKQVRRYLVFVGLLVFLTSAFLSVDALILGALLPAEFIGFYRVAVSIVISIGSLLTISTVMFPVFSQLKKPVLRHAFDRAIKYSLALSIPAAFGTFYLATPIVLIFFGQSYILAAIPLAILALLIVELSVGPLLQTLLLARDFPQYVTAFSAAGLTINATLSILLIPTIGIAGAAFAALSSRYIALVGIAWAVKSKVNLRINLRFIYKPIAASAAMFAPLFLLPVPLGAPFLSVVAFATLEILVAIAVYFAVLYAIRGITSEDVAYIRNLFKA